MLVGHTECPAEREQQSEHSPGMVADGERLARIVYHRDHVEAGTGRLTPGAIRISDLEVRGLSLVRLWHVTAEELQRRGEDFAARREENRLEGVGVAIARQVRSLRDGEARQALCVIDDGKSDFRAHAIAIRSADQDRPALLKLRGALIDFFSPVRSIGEAMADRHERLRRVGPS